MHDPITTRHARAAVLAVLVMSAGCDRSANSLSTPLDPGNPTESRSVTEANPAVLAQLGERIFHDRELSLKHNQSCASCHDAGFGFSSPNSDINDRGAVMFGSVSNRFGNRKPPSAAYATQSPVMFYDEEDDTFVGGNFWGSASHRRRRAP